MGRHYPKDFQANIMAVVVKGLMFGDLPWTPILIGGVLAVAIELLGVPALPVAIGLYLPITLSTPIMAGGLVAMYVRKKSSDSQFGARNLRGILFSSGIVAGDALLGVFVAGIIMSSVAYNEFYTAHNGMLESLSGNAGPWLALAIFVAFTFYLGRMAMKGMGEKI